VTSAGYISHFEIVSYKIKTINSPLFPLFRKYANHILHLSYSERFSISCKMLHFDLSQYCSGCFTEL